MQQHDWDFHENRFLAYVLNGQDEKGNRIDDDFLVMVSGNSCGDMDVRLPDMPHKGRWQLVFDTSKSCSYKDDNKYQKGDRYIIKPYSVVVFANRRPSQRENQNIRPVVNIKDIER
jgi:pullulanase/glycogen debranching enzyme